MSAQYYPRPRGCTRSQEIALARQREANDNAATEAHNKTARHRAAMASVLALMLVLPRVA